MYHIRILSLGLLLSIETLNAGCLQTSANVVYLPTNSNDKYLNTKTGIQTQPSLTLIKEKEGKTGNSLM